MSSMATIDYEWTMTKIRRQTLDDLIKIKLVDGETYDEVIQRLLWFWHKNKEVKKDEM